MSSYMLLKKLSSLPLDKQKYVKLQDEKEELNKNLHQVLPLLKKILRNQDNICRICLQTGSRAIFQPGNTTDLAADILYALGIEINQDDTGPQCICYSCEKGVMAAAELKRMANISNWRLQQEAELVTKTFSQCSESSHTEGLHGGYFIINKGIVERTWRCGKCRKLFQSQEELIAHEAQVSCRRRRIEPYVCEVCGKEFRRAFPLNQHRAIHSNELLYPCTLCPYRGRTRAALVGHIKLHSGEKTIQCPQCPATFASYSNLGSHRRTHNPPKYKCYHCNKSFMFQQSLKNHIISQHSSTKAYNCIGCDKSFALRKHLRQHELKAHNRPKCNAGAVPLYIKLQLNNSE